MIICKTLTSKVFYKKPIQNTKKFETIVLFVCTFLVKRTHLTKSNIHSILKAKEGRFSWMNPTSTMTVAPCGVATRKGMLKAHPFLIASFDLSPFCSVA